MKFFTVKQKKNHELAKFEPHENDMMPHIRPHELDMAPVPPALHRIRSTANAFTHFHNYAALFSSMISSHLSATSLSCEM